MFPTMITAGIVFFINAASSIINYTTKYMKTGTFTRQVP